MKTLLALTLSLIVSFSALAQAEPPGCTITDINAVIISMMSDISTLQTATLDNDISAVLAALAILDERVNALQSACAGDPPADDSAGLTFSGSASRVTAPFEIPPGTYRVTGAFVPEDFGSAVSVTLTRMSGECALDFTDTMFLFYSDGETEETLLQSNGCEALLEITGSMREWTIKFDLIR